MNRRWFCLAVVCCLITVPAFGVDPPKTPPPEMGEAALVEDGHLKLGIASLYRHLVTKEVQKIVDGVPRTEQVSVLYWGKGERAFDVPPAGYLVMTIGGQRLDEAAVKKLFADKTPILVSMHGKRIDPNYVAVFKPETPVLYVRPSGVIAHGVAAPASANLAPPAQVFVSHLQVVPQPAPSASPAVAVGAVMPPFQATSIAANGKLTVVEYTWREFPLWKTKELEKRVPQTIGGDIPLGGEIVVKEIASVGETVWAPTKQVAEFSFADCQVIGHDGQPVANVDLAARLTKNTAILWLQEGMTLDTRFCQFLKPDALIVKTPAPPMPAYEGSLSCAPHLDFCLAQAKGDELTLTKVVFECHWKDVTYTVQVNGVPETRVKKVCETVSKPVHNFVKLSDYAAMSPAENGLAAKWLPEDLQKHLAKQTPVLVCEWPQLDPKQLKLLKPGVIILTAKGHGGPAPLGEAAPIPGPAPAPATAPPPPAN